MIRKASESPIHSDEQVEGIVSQALAQALRDDVPDELRPTVFQTAAGLYAQKQIEWEQIAANVALPNGRALGL